jgi:leader peptidase (prepilin peptidase)/N-methyltransferase
VPDTFFLIIATFLGLCIGSFLNVCIYRLPLKRSVMQPARSYCPHCETTIAAYDNIPLFSYLILGGRCRHCRTRISWRYPAVELLTGILALLCAFYFGFSVAALIYFLFTAALLLITFIDFDHQIIPDRITLPGIPLCVLAAICLPSMTLSQSLIGMLAGGGSLFAVAWVYHLITGKHGMGGGDIKLLAMIGALIGWQGVIFTIFISSAVGSLAGLVVMLQRRGNLKIAVPFGPFLSLGATVYVFWGSDLIGWYAGTML